MISQSKEKEEEEKRGRKREGRREGKRGRLSLSLRTTEGFAVWSLNIEGVYD